MRKSVTFSLLSALLASACATGPAYEPPAPPADMADNFVTTDTAFDPAAPLPEAWWRLYDDPVLDDLVSQALQANTDLRVAAANLEAARAVLSQAQAARLPSTAVNGGVEYGDAVQTGFGADAQWSERASASVSWEADLFGRLRHAVDAAQANSEAVEAARDAVRVTVAAETTRAYLNACAYSQSLEVARQSHETSRESLALIEDRRQAGAVDDFDVERAAARVATARAQIPFYSAQRDRSLLELAALLGRTPGNIPEAARSCDAPSEPVAVLPIGDGTALLRRRPDLRQAERQMAAATAQIGVATADLYPTVSLGGTGSFFRNDLVKGDDSFTFSLGPAVSWSLPNITSARARLRQAEAQGDAALATFDGKVITALKEVEQALATVSGEQAQLDALKEAQERSERAYDLADLKFRAGSIAYVDVLVAQADLLSTRAAYTASLQRLSSARVDLFRALGGGWQAEEAPA